MHCVQLDRLNQKLFHNYSDLNIVNEKLLSNQNPFLLLRLRSDTCGQLSEFLILSSRIHDLKVAWNFQTTTWKMLGNFVNFYS